MLPPSSSSTRPVDPSRSKRCTFLGAGSLCRNGDDRKILLLDGTGRQFISVGDVSSSALHDLVFNQLPSQATGQG